LEIGTLNVVLIIGLEIIELYGRKVGKMINPQRKRRKPKRKSFFDFGKNKEAGINPPAWFGLEINLKVMAKKVTSKAAASAASKVLRDGRTSSTSKTAAGSALSQREKGGKKK
jgi:hypothetical protein